MNNKIADLNEKIEKVLAKIEKKEATIVKKQKSIDKKYQQLIKMGINNPEEVKSYDHAGWNVNRNAEAFWVLCDVETLKEDIERGKLAILELKFTMEKYRLKLEDEQHKASEVIPVVEEFLNQWVDSAKSFYIEQYKQLLNRHEERNAIKEEVIAELNSKGVYYSWQDVEKVMESRGFGYRDFNRKMYNQYGHLVISMYENNDAESRLNKVLENDKAIKRDILTTRVKDVVGTITDASGLYIANNGEINGFIIGDKGKATVETIYAGGYNIQRLHFRVLVKEVNK